ncbi:MAG: ComEC/Rec2 family competence protein [Patescibacteria group bacterium]|nr:ComEC/Rec2 family competence protein [Patescibacteria group bacterium]
MVFEKYQNQSNVILFGKKTAFTGIVDEIKEQNENQKFVINLQHPHSGKILIKLKPYPAYERGDIIKFEGTIANYRDFKKEIYGISNYPQNKLIGKKGGAIKLLTGFKNKIINNIKMVLPSEKSAFLSGIILGETSEFSRELKNAMSKSGTTHIVALSGYNITILVKVVFGFLIWFLNRKISFYITIVSIIAFVLMTGAQSSVVRAAIMGGILLLAQQVGRVHSIKNAIAVSAFVMVLFNPKILRFDLGFQLSFLAFIGMAYLLPAIENFFRVNKEKDFFNMKENLLATLSAQLAVFPLLISSFKSFSLFSLVSNILILSFISLTMTLGFIIGALGFVSYYLSLVFSWAVYPFLTYELLVIKLFGQMPSAKISDLNIIFSAIYYLMLIIFIFYMNRRPDKRQI